MIDAASAAQSWVEGIANAQAKATRKINAVTTNPAQQAIAAASLWQQAVSSASALAAFKKGLSGVQLGDWQTAMIQRGLPHAAEGAREKQQKFASAIAPVLSAVASVQSQVKQMPKGPRGSEQNIARSAAFQRGMAQYRRSKLGA